MIKKHQRVELYGNASDPIVQESIRKIKAGGRKVELKARPSFDTGTGPCGRHQCNCREICQAEYYNTL